MIKISETLYLNLDDNFIKGIDKSLLVTDCLGKEVGKTTKSKNDKTLIEITDKNLIDKIKTGPNYSLSTSYKNMPNIPNKE